MAPLPGICCLEGPWDSRLTDAMSVHPILELLSGWGNVPYVYRDVATREELVHYLKKWTQKGYSNYSVCYLAFHGEKPATLNLGDRVKVSLPDLGQELRGRLAGKTVFFGACWIFHGPWGPIDEFLIATKARAACGYSLPVEFIEAAAFEVLLLAALTGVRDPARAFRNVEKRESDFVERLRFRSRTRAEALSDARPRTRPSSRGS